MYATRRARIASERKNTFQSDENEPVNRIVPLTLKTMEQQCKHDARFNTKTLASWANEVYLFHGTKASLCLCTDLKDSAFVVSFVGHSV